MEGTSNAASKAKLESLKSQLADLNQETQDQKYEHEYELRVQGLDKLKEDSETALNELLENLKRSTELQNKVISDLLSNAQANIKTTTELINERIRETGVVVSDITKTSIEKLGDTTTKLGNWGSTYGDVKTAAEQFKTANDLANSSIINTGDAIESATKKVNEYIEALKKVNNQDTSNMAGTSKQTAELPKENIPSNPTPTTTTATTTAKTTTTTAKTTQQTTLESLVAQSKANVTASDANNAKVDLKKKAVAYVKKYASNHSPSRKRADYSDVNKKIWDYTGGKVLSTTEMKNLAKALGVTYDNAKSSGALYKKLKAIGFPKFARGSQYIKQDQLGWTQDAGQELVYRRADGAILTPLNQGDKVFTAEMTDNLWKMSKMFSADAMTRNVTDASSITNINNSPNLTITFDNLINVEGNADQNVLKDMERIAEKQIDAFEKRIMDGMKMNGHKMRF